MPTPVANLFDMAPQGADRDVTVEIIPNVIDKYEAAKLEAKKKAAARQAKHRAKKDAALGEISASLDVLVNALAQAGCAKLVRGIDPIDPGAAIKLLAERIGEGRLIYAKKETPEARRARAQKAAQIKKAKATAAKIEAAR